MEVVTRVRSFGGEQLVCRHDSRATGTSMRFGVYLPPAAAKGAKTPVVWFLSGLTCTEANFTEKAGAQRLASELGLILVVPDTSPRGEGGFCSLRSNITGRLDCYVSRNCSTFHANNKRHSQQVCQVFT